MPGCRENTEDIIHAVKSGEEKEGYKIPLADLQFCARNVLHIVAKTINKKEKERGLWCSNCCDSAVGTCTFRKFFAFLSIYF